MEYEEYSPIQEDDNAPAAVTVPVEQYKESSSWQKTLDKVVPAVIAIRFCTVRHFDTERASFSVATGFIVDKKRGIVLTNRHVVRPGPVTAEAIFLDHEEVKLFPIYRDPVHDFGFFRFNPADVKFMEVSEIELDPEGAKVGVEIRVVGNDAGEKLSILSGTLARLDRPAPTYGEDEFNDFNTFYYQAASSTSGGSSGSPVLNISGKAVALNAGGRRKAASSFYLPLNRVLRALQIIQSGGVLTPPRGDLQTVFRHMPYDEVHRLGLRRETEVIIRQKLPHETGMLVVDQVIPESVAHKLLEPGDIVVRVEGELATTFLKLEEVFDAKVGETVSVEIERGGQPMTLNIKVQDLHAVSPDSFLEVGGGILHALSYQQARNHRLPVGGVYIASDGYMLGRAGLHKGNIIKTVGSVETPDLDRFIQAFCSHPNDARVPVQYFNVTDRHQLRLSVIYVDRCWHSMQRWTRDDAKGLWTSVECPPPPTLRYLPKPTPAAPLVTNIDLAAEIVQSFVMVSFHIPYVIDGGCSDNYLGAGLIVDAERGLVLVDQNTVPLTIGDLLLSFGSTVEIPAKVLYIHPIHNFAILQYDPSLLSSNSSFKSANISYEPLNASDNVYLVGLTRSDQPFCQSTTVSKIEEVFINEARPPRFRATNEDVIHLEKSTSCVGGVLVDNQRRIRALWASYSSSEKKSPTESFEIFRGMPMHMIEDILQQLRRGDKPVIRSLEAEFWPIPLSKARDLGLSENWINAIKDKYVRRHILCVRRLVAKTDASLKLKTGDVLLAINNNTATTFREVEKAIQNESEVDLTILRNQEEIQVRVATTTLAGHGTDKVVCWCGAILQNTHRAVAQLGFLYEGVYCSRWFYGSPAHQFGLRAVHWIVEINGKPTPNIDSFLTAIRECRDSSFLRLKVMGLQDKVSVLSIKVDYHYWPTWVISLDKVSAEWSFEKFDVSEPANDNTNNESSSEAPMITN